MPSIEELLIEKPRSSARINQVVRVQEHQHRLKQWERQAQEDLDDRLLRIREAYEAEPVSLLAHEAQGDSRVEEIQPEGNRSRCGAILCGLGIHEGKWEYVTNESAVRPGCVADAEMPRSG